MADTVQVHTRLTRKKPVREYNARGDIYAWLRAHHGEIARCTDVERRPWAVLIPEMVADGVRREDGQEPIVRNVSRIWERVCRDVEADAKVTKPKRNFPSRNSPDWRPKVVPQTPGVAQRQAVAQSPVVAPPPVRPPPRLPGTALQTGSAGAGAQSRDPDMSPEVRAKIDAAFEDLAAADKKNFGW